MEATELFESSDRLPSPPKRFGTPKKATPRHVGSKYVKRKDSKNRGATNWGLKGTETLVYLYIGMYRY